MYPNVGKLIGTRSGDLNGVSHDSIAFPPHDPIIEVALNRSDLVLVRVVDEAVVFVVSVHVFHPKVLQVLSASCHWSENVPTISLVDLNVQS